MTSTKLTAVFLTPPNVNAVRTSLIHLESEGGVGFKPPLGLLYVASHAARHTEHDIRVIDSEVEGLQIETAAERVCALNPDVVGISVLTDFWYPAVATLEAIKRRRPECFTVVGGPHALVFPALTLAHSSVDAVVAGDGETPMLRLLECLSSGVLRNNIPGLHFKQFGVHAHIIHQETELDSLTPPDRTLLPLEPYYSILGKDSLATTMITSRGCPNNCVFCKIGSQRPVRHSAEYVLAEFDTIHRLGISEVEIYDDTFTWSHDRVIEICKGLIDRNYDIRWAIRDRVNNVKEDTLRWMKRAGCTRIHYGIESGSDEVLQRVKKRITVEQAFRAVTLAHDIGFETLAFFMFGLPGESVEDIRKTIDLSLRIPADYCQYSIAVAYPGTSMYTDAIEQGLIHDDYWSNFVRAPQPDFLVPGISLCQADTEALVHFRDEAIRRFYMRPRTIWNELKKLRSLKEFKRKARMGFSLLRSAVRNKHA